MIEANNPTFTTWIETPPNSDFPIQNIPFGVAVINNKKTVVTRIGDTVIIIYCLFFIWECKFNFSNF